MPSNVLSRSVPFLLLAAVVLAAQQPEQVLAACESPLPQHLEYGDRVEGGRIWPTGADVDSFTFDGVTGDEVLVVVDGYSNGLGARIEVLDPSFVPVALATTCSANIVSTCSTEFTAILPSSGTFRVNVSDSGLNNTGNYGLQLHRLWPVPPAPQLIHGGSARLEYLWSTDVDHFSFQGAPGTLVSLTVSGLTNDLDPMVQIIDATGTVIGTKACSANSISTCIVSMTNAGASPDFAFTTSGVYTVRVQESGRDNNGSYNISLSCTAGFCSNSPIVGCGGLGAPTVTSLDPGALSTAGGHYPCLLRGTNFCKSGALSVTVGGIAMTDLIVHGTTEIQFTPPNLPAGIHDLVVSTSNGSVIMPAFVEVGMAPLFAIPPTVANHRVKIGMHGGVVSASALILADVSLGQTNLPGPNSQLDFFSPTLIVIADPTGVLSGSPLTCAETSSNGTWAYRPAVPPSIVGSGLTLYLEAFLIEGSLANGFEKSSTVTLVL